MTDTKLQPSPDAPGTDNDQTKPKTPVATQVLNSSLLSEHTDISIKPSVTGHVSLLQ